MEAPAEEDWALGFERRRPQGGRRRAAPGHGSGFHRRGEGGTVSAVPLFPVSRRAGRHEKTNRQSEGRQPFNPDGGVWLMCLRLAPPGSSAAAGGCPLHASVPTLPVPLSFF